MPSKRKEKEVELEKSDLEGFRGGLDVDLKKKIEGQELRDILSKHIDTVLDQEIKNQESRIDKIADWNRSYRGERDERNWPYPNCANVAIPITRSNVDAIHVRLIDALLNQFKVWVLKAKVPEYQGVDRVIEDGLDHFQKNVLKLRSKLNSPILQSVKTGLGMIKVVHETKTRTRYRYAKPEEIQDDNIPKFTLPGTDSLAVTDVETIYQGPNVYAISREDWICSSNAITVQDAYICGFRKYYRYEELKYRTKKEIYYETEFDRIVNPDKYDETKEERAESEGKELKQTDYTEPYEVWELWLKYDVNDDGEPDDIVVTFHRDSGAILRCIYNPLFAGFRPFLPFVFYPSEFSVEGEGICEIIETLQEEIDTLHNLRLDRMVQINAPMIFVRAGTNLEDFEIMPGKVTIVDGELEQAIKEFTFSDTTFTTQTEEDRLIAMADRACGITPSVMGQSTAERPVAKETFALIQEANKKFKYGIDNLRNALTELAYMLLEFFAQYQPTYTYKTVDGNEITEQTVNFPVELIRDGFQVDLVASSEMFNQEARRQIALTKYHMLGDYYSKMATVAVALTDPTVHPEFKKWLVASSQSTEQQMEEILKDFQDPSAEKTVVGIADTMDVEQLLTMPPPQMPMPGPEEEMQGGPPPQGMM